MRQMCARIHSQNPFIANRNGYIHWMKASLRLIAVTIVITGSKICCYAYVSIYNGNSACTRWIRSVATSAVIWIFTVIYDGTSAEIEIDFIYQKNQNNFASIVQNTSLYCWHVQSLITHKRTHIRIFGWDKWTAAFSSISWAYIKYDGHATIYSHSEFPRCNGYTSHVSSLYMHVKPNKHQNVFFLLNITSPRTAVIPFHSVRNKRIFLGNART